MVMDVLTWELKDWKGLNTSPNTSTKDPQYVEDCQNVEFDDRGTIQKRRGTQTIAMDQAPPPAPWVFPDAWGYWRFDESIDPRFTAEDFTGNGHTLYNDIAYYPVESAIGKIGTSAYFPEVGVLI
jgi:hypothetical protein